MRKFKLNFMNGLNEDKKKQLIGFKIDKKKL